MAVYNEDTPLLPRSIAAARADRSQATPTEDTLDRPRAKARSSKSWMRHPMLLTLGAGALVSAVFVSTSRTLKARARENASDSIVADGKQYSSLLREGGHGEAGFSGGTSGGGKTHGPGDTAGSGREQEVTASGQRARESWRLASKKSPGAGGATDERDEGSAEQASKPNVFVFLIDDMGFDDIGYQSTDLSKMTPNLDALAAGGIKLTHYYSMSICTPARASLMTGRYPVRYGMQYSVLVPGAPWGLPLNEKVLPQYMNDAGYESHMVGKWHIGSHVDASLPSRRGFNTFLGYLNGEDNYYTHKNVEVYLEGKSFYDFGYGNETGYYDITSTGDGRACETHSGLDEATSPTDACYVEVYSTDVFLNRARQVVEQKTPWDEEPLFMYIAHQSVHAPLSPVPPGSFTEAEQALLDAVEDATTMRRELAGVLMYMDKRIGEFVDMLEANGWLENSLIVVASDNGACPRDGGSNYPLRGVKQSVFEGGTRVPAFVYSQSHIPQHLWGTTYSNMIHVTDWVPTLVSAARGGVEGSAGALDGVDHWSALLRIGEAGEGTNAPRNELLYNWDPYLMSSSYGLNENFGKTQGAFRVGKWKLLVNTWCSGYYSHDVAVLEADPMTNSTSLCGERPQCQDCCDSCQNDTAYSFGNRLVDLEQDPREVNNVILEHPEIATALRLRAEEVVFSEWVASNYMEVNEDSRLIWKAHGWWMLPWADRMSP